MAIAIKAPTFPESITDGTVVTWHKKPGDHVSRDELLVDIETDKVVLEVVAPDDGQLQRILKSEGDVVASEEVIGEFEKIDGAVNEENKDKTKKDQVNKKNNLEVTQESGADSQHLSPAARRLIEENKLDVNAIQGTGKNNRVTKEDILNYLEQQQQSKPSEPKVVSITPQKQDDTSKVAVSSSVLTELPEASNDRVEKRVPMTRLRARVAERLIQAQQTAAILTTFNEVNMQPVMTMRKRYQEEFEKTHNVRLGFMSFFVKATTEALKRFPEVNASIDGTDIIYHGYYDVGVAVSSDRGLVVPILRDTDKKNLAEIEQAIMDYAMKAKSGKLSIEDMSGGTFTISNGGVFGSLMSTPILNPPQTGILGMHKIQERPMVVGGKVVVLPMMYLALSYDHRLIDGKQAVEFLVLIKNLIEDPTRLLLDL